MVLKPQDIVVVLKLVCIGSRDVSFAKLAESVGMSPSEVHAGVGRAQHARLYSEETRQPIRRNLEEFLIHGVKYAFPAEIGGKSRGIPTAYAAPVMKDVIASSEDPLPPVWPYESGPVSGLAFSPLYKSVSVAVQTDPELYDLLSIVDAIRFGRVREQAIAAKLLQERLVAK